MTSPCQEIPVPEGLDLSKVQLKDFSREELRQWVLDELGEKKFRAEQIYNWLYARQAANFDEMTNLSKKLRAKLENKATINRIVPHEYHPSADGTTKVTFKCWDGAVIESVWIPNGDRNTLCVSSQVGCALGCTFCLTARMGLKRNLSAGEIVDQIVHARRLFREEEHGRLTNIVMMGMGEPLHNYDNVVKAMGLMICQDGLGLASRRVTLSTSGLVPQIKKLGEDINVQLAVSLNATTNELRDEIMPINLRYPIEVLLQTLREFPLKQRRRITIEYVMLGGVNDTMDDAKRLAKMLKGIPCKVNLIPWNAHSGVPFTTPERSQVTRFQDYMLSQHYNCLIRETRGLDAMAACGMLGRPGMKIPKRLLRVEEKRRAKEEVLAEA